MTSRRKSAPEPKRTDGPEWLRHLYGAMLEALQRPEWERGDERLRHLQAEARYKLERAALTNGRQ